jgi:hypothetical protein
MRLTRAVLVIADISGYTGFIKHRAVSLLHAEQIITDLLDAVLDHASHPLQLNKLEGDAALLYAETHGDDTIAVHDALSQVHGFFSAFAQRRVALTQAKRHCQCEACANLSGLGLKAFVHVGEVAIKRVRQFEEIAGEEVILIHRLLKNHIPEREYVLLTPAAYAALQEHAPPCSELREDIEGLDPITVRWFATDAHAVAPHAPPRLSTLAATAADRAPPQRERTRFHHLERYTFTVWQRLRDAVVLSFLALFGRR